VYWLFILESIAEGWPVCALISVSHQNGVTDSFFMNDKLLELTELFCRHGGIFENMTVGYREEGGYYCSVIDSHQVATVFSPVNLLVDVGDIGISHAGLFISRPENYGDNIGFLDEYFSYHFDEALVDRLHEEKRQIDSLSEKERLLLKRVNLPNVINGVEDNLEYVKNRILQFHQITFEPHGKKVIMPFVTFLNHDREGTGYIINESGITVTGKYNGEVFAHYQMGDVLMILMNYGFVTNTMFIYSLPMHIRFPDGRLLMINNEISKFKRIDGKYIWPVVENKDCEITVSWFPMYFKSGPWYPARFARSISQEFNLPAEDILYSVFRFNLNALLPIVISLKESENSYVQMVVSGIERQLELIGGVE
jgi:hypothetical protein